MFQEFLKKNFWQSLFAGTAGSGRTKFTFEELRALSDVLNKNQVVTEANRAVVVETIRSIAEFMIWGDQNEPRIFDYFMENNVMHYLHRVLQQPANRTGDVAKQVLQTLSIIIQNIRSETGTYFLFSNNHINNIVEIRFDFEDEEVLGYYISFLKTISLKLNAGTVQFFFDRRDDSAYTFPLYSEAVKFAHHKEGMVRAGVRTLTLNVYSVPDPYIQDYVCRPPATSYLVDMASYIADQVKILDKRMASAEGFSAQVLSSLDSQLAEVEDMISYVSDILNTAHPKFAHLTAEQLWVSLVGPYLLRPLLEYGTSKAAGQPAAGLRRTSAGGGSPSSPRPALPHIRASCSLYCLERLLVLITYPPLLNNLALALLDPRVGHPSCRQALVSLLRTEDHRAVPAALRCLVALVHNRHMAPEVLAMLGLVPRARTADLHAACSAGDCAACRLQEQLGPLPEGCGAAGAPPDPLADDPLPVATVASSSFGPGAPVFGYHVVWTRMEGPAQGSLERQDYGDRYVPDNDVDVSNSSFSEATGAGRPAQLQGQSQDVSNRAEDEEEEEGQEETEVEGGEQEREQDQGSRSSEVDLLGLAQGEAADALLPPLASPNPLAADVLASGVASQPGAPSSTIRNATDALLGDAPAAADAAALQKTSRAQPPARSQPLEGLAQVHSDTAPEVEDLLGLGEVAVLGISGGEAGTEAAHRAGPSDAAEASGGDLIALDATGGPATAESGSSQSAASPLDPLAPLATSGSTRSLNAAASGSLLDSSLEGASSGAPQLPSPSHPPKQTSLIDEPLLITKPSEGHSLIDEAPPGNTSIEPAVAPSGTVPADEAVRPESAGVPPGEELLSLDDEEPAAAPSVSLVAAGPDPESRPSVEGPADLLDAPLQPSGEPAAATAALVPTVESSATAAEPLADLLGPTTPPAIGASAAAVSETAAADALAGTAAGSNDDANAGALDPVEGLGGGTAESAVSALSEQHSRLREDGEPASSGSVPAPPPPPPAAPLPPPAAPPPVMSGPPCTAHARPVAMASSPDILDTLFALLSMQLLPIPSLWNVVLLLGQLYPRAQELRELKELQQQHQQLNDPLQPHLPTSTAAADPLADLLGVQDELVGAASGSGSGSGGTPTSATPGGPLAAPEEAEAHPLHPSSTAGWACELNASQREALRCAAVSAASAVLDEVGGMWCDALVAMLVLEWPAAYDAVTRPALRTGAEQLMGGPHLYPRQHARGLSGSGRNDQGLSGSAVAALHSHHAVARLVALLLLHDLLFKGSTERRPPASCPMPPGSDLEQRELDLLEGQEVELQAGSAIPCIVSFSPGQERRVYFAASGPALRRLSDYLHNPQALLSDPAAQAVVMHSSPAVILADPAPTRLNAGIVLSVSPLLGSDPSVDKNVPKWLHVHVRPSVRGLLRLLRSAAAGRKGGLLGALRHLVDGHWVLAFPDAERASNARQLVEQSAHRLRALYCELLSPVLSTVMD